MKTNVMRFAFQSGGHRLRDVLAFGSVILLLAGQGCNSESAGTEPAVECSGVLLSFTDDVFPVIQSSCAKSTCHAAGSNNGPGELLTYSQINRAKNSIQASVATGEMPKNSRLSANEKNIILCWIENGASNN